MRVEGPVDVAGTTADGRPFYETYVTEKLTGIGMYLSLSADCSAAEDGSGWRAMERGGKETGKPKHSPPPPPMSPSNPKAQRRSGFSTIQTVAAKEANQTGGSRQPTSQAKAAPLTCWRTTFA